jgi:hypothetical protein
VQWRAVRAAILLMGDSGLRREEAASARRENLPAPFYGTLDRPVWELTLVGKGSGSARCESVRRRASH